MTAQKSKSIFHTVVKEDEVSELTVGKGKSF
jgi:hypothetical protein